MVSKAQVYMTKTDKIFALDKDMKNLYALNRSRITVPQVHISTGAIPSAAGSQGGTGNFLETQGDTMIGPIAFAQALILIDVDGRIKIGEQDRNTANSPLSYRSYVALTAGVSPDDVYWIDGASYNGQLLYVQGNVSQIINLNNAIQPNISNIVGLGTVTVTTAIAHGLTTGRIVNILGTTNFNAQSVSVTVTSTTIFTYSATGSATPETSGVVEDGNILSNDGTIVVLDGTADNFTRPVCQLLFDEIDNAWRVVSRPDSVSGGISFPIDFPEDDRGTVGASTQNIVFTNSTRHSVKMIVSGDVDLAFSSPPTNETAYTNIIIVQDGTGGHTVTVPSGTINKAKVDAGILTGADEETGIVVKFAFGTFYAFLETGNIVSGGGFSGNLSDLTIDVQKNWAAQGISNFGALLGVTSIDMDGASPLIEGVKTIRFVDDDPNKTIASTAIAIEYAVPVTEQHSFFAGTDELFRIDQISTGPNVTEINIFQASIEEAGEIIFTTSSDAIIGATEPGIGYDATNFDMIFNIPTNASAEFQWKIAGTVIARMSISGANEQFETDIFNVLQHVIFQDGTVPAVNGVMARNGVDVKVFSGGALRNMSDIPTGTPANTTLSNLTSPTSINQDLIPQAGKLLGNSGNPWSTVTSNKFSLGTAGTFAASDNAIIADATTGMEFNTPSGDIYRWFFNAVAGPSMSVSELDMITGGFQGSKLQLTDTIDPVSTGELRRNGSSVKWEADSFDIRRTTLVSAEASTLNLIKIDSGAVANDDVGTISFQVFDTPTLTTYGDITVTITNATDAGVMVFNVRADNGLLGAMSLTGDDNNQRFMMLMGGTDQARIQPSLGEMGYFVTTQVTDFSLVIGTSGSLEIPRLADNSPTLAALNSAFGAFDGAFGYESVDEKLYVRESATRWVFFNTDGAVT